MVLALACTNDFDALQVGASDADERPCAGSSPRARRVDAKGAPPVRPWFRKVEPRRARPRLPAASPGAPRWWGVAGWRKTLPFWAPPTGRAEHFVDAATFPAVRGLFGRLVRRAAPQHPTIRFRRNATAGLATPAVSPTAPGARWANLCAAGWHVCTSAGDVASHSLVGCDPALGGGMGHW